MRKLALFLILLLACAASVASADDPFLSGEALSAKGQALVEGQKGESAGGAALSIATTSADDLV